MLVNVVPWSLLNKVSQVSWVSECLKCYSASSTRVFWVAEELSVSRIFIKFLQSVQMWQNFGSLFVWINKFVRNAALTGWFSCRNCLKKLFINESYLHILTLQNSIQAVELARHTLGSKDNVWYCLKRYIKSIFCKTQKWAF